MTSSRPILLLSDSPASAVAADLKILYPERVETKDFIKEDHGPTVLGDYDAVLTMVHDGAHLSQLDFGALEDYARAGGNVICCLFEYARHRGLSFSKTHVCNRMRPAIRIEQECDITRGFAKGDEVPWYGTVSGAPDLLYQNQMYQRQVLDVKESECVAILGTSTVNGGAVMVLEKIGSGHILALDLMSPQRPFYNSPGGTNKYLFLGNFIGASVRYGKHYPKRLSYDEFVLAMRQTTVRFPQLRMQAAGPCSDGRPLWTLGIGDETKPTLYFGAAIHGWEWENAFGLLRFMEVLCEQPQVEGIDTSQLHVMVMPIQNPAGYDAFTRQNARGVDLNRNFDVGWQELAVPQDVAVPWDYNYKGARAASEPETQAIQSIIDRYKPVAAVDFHTADYVMLLPHQGDDPLVEAIHEDIKARLKDRYVTQKPYNGPYQQVNMERRTGRAKSPYLICYAAEQGALAAFLIEMSGNRDDVHAMVMNTDTVVEICLATASQCLNRLVGQAD